MEAGPNDRANVFEKHGEGGDSANGIEEAQAVRMARGFLCGDYCLLVHACPRVVPIAD